MMTHLISKAKMPRWFCLSIFAVLGFIFLSIALMASGFMGGHGGHGQHFW